jgi:hypothetical protein
MVKRKGQLTPSQIDREYPAQAILTALDHSARWREIDAVKAERGGAPLGHSLVIDDVQHVVTCFRDEGAADEFVAIFGGKRFDPATRSRSSWAHLKADVARRRVARKW